MNPKRILMKYRESRTYLERISKASRRREEKIKLAKYYY